MSRARILFVDDDVAILDALRDLLRKDQERWEMTFVGGGPQALSELRKAPFDIVLTDMLMPGMDGAELLARVKADYPGTARIILCGQAEREAVLRAVPVAQQFLTKPCDAAVIRSAIERTHGLSKLLESEAIRRVVGRLEQLPSVPQTYSELTRAAADPALAVADIADIVQRDPAMCVKVLQLVNSAYFGVPQRVASIQRAVTYLGVELLKGLALTAHVFAVMEAHPVAGFSLERLQNHSVLTAQIARRLLTTPKAAEEAFTAALVHDVGKIVVALGLPSRFSDLVRESARSGRPFHAVEKEILDVTHAEVGAYLLGVWGLPFSIVESVAYHHHPGVVTDGPCDILVAVHAADALADPDFDEAGAAPGSVGLLDLAFIDRSGHAADLPWWRAVAEQEKRRAAESQMTQPVA